MEYQIARQEREKQITENLNRQGIEPENYPQLGNSFWGTSSNNNYGFGSSNIHDNIENRENQTKYVRDCTPFDIAKRGFEVYKMSNSPNPFKTGNKAVDFVLGKIPVIKRCHNRSFVYVFSFCFVYAVSLIILPILRFDDFYMITPCVEMPIHFQSAAGFEFYG